MLGNDKSMKKHKSVKKFSYWREFSNTKYFSVNFLPILKDRVLQGDVNIRRFVPLCVQKYDWNLSKTNLLT